MYTLVMWLLFVLLSTFAWALVNVLNSVFVHNYVKSPIALTWIQSCISLPLLLLISFWIDVRSSWILVLILFGITAYAADLWFFYVLNHVDVSVLNASWSILSLFLSIVGFFFFHESWSFQQSAGSLMIIGGTLLLSLYHQHINLRFTLYLFSTLALLYLPYYIVKKVAIDAGESAAAVFFWMLIGREILSISLPLVLPLKLKSHIRNIGSDYFFFAICFLTVSLYFLAEYFGALAYLSGPLSLVSVIANVQPFMVMCVAWVWIAFCPSKAPRELLTQQSISIKIVSFCLVFLGLTLLTVSH